MALFDKTFPTLDCAACILTPKMNATGKHKNIEILSYSEVVEVSGYVGNFKVKIKKKPRKVDVDVCTGCSACWNNCPSALTPSKPRRIIKKGEYILFNGPRRYNTVERNR